MTGPIAVVGLWHLGCSIAAAWTSLGRRVRAVDFDTALIVGLRDGRPPLFEPGLAETLGGGLTKGTLEVSTDATAVRGCSFVFVAFDTPVRDDDTSDVSPIVDAIERIGPHLDRDAIVIVSAQLPIGASRQLRTRLQSINPSVELVYSPENLRLGEAIRCYLEPGHIVIGAESENAGAAVERLFAPMNARCFRLNLPGAEMVKHCINSFLATSVTLANQWCDIASAMGADYGDVTEALRADPRIGARAYITPGIGFSGGTLGRDLQVLDGVNVNVLDGQAPLFGQVWSYNRDRARLIARQVAELVGSDGHVALLGMTYKPGTSTLRRSLPLSIAAHLLDENVRVSAHDPRADWSGAEIPPGLAISETPYDACDGTDLAALLTEWPDYHALDFGRLAGMMRCPRMLDPKGFFRRERDVLQRAGISIVPLVQALHDVPV